MSRGAWFIVITLVALLGLSIYMAVDVWMGTEAAAVASGPEGQVSGHGIVALVLGGLGSIIVGGGLMALVFLSHRSGHDDSVHREYQRRVDDRDGPLP